MLDASSMPRLALRTLSPFALLAVALFGCRDINPPPRSEAHCQVACERQARGCSEHECARGCAFILDRLVENEGAPVLACVAARAGATTAKAEGGACGDPVWADCAAGVGVHADGGPPAPRPPQE